MNGHAEAQSTAELLRHARTTRELAARTAAENQRVDALITEHRGRTIVGPHPQSVSAEED